MVGLTSWAKATSLAILHPRSDPETLVPAALFQSLSPSVPVAVKVEETRKEAATLSAASCSGLGSGAEAAVEAESGHFHLAGVQELQTKVCCQVYFVARYVTANISCDCRRRVISFLKMFFSPGHRVHGTLSWQEPEMTKRRCYLLPYHDEQA